MTISTPRFDRRGFLCAGACSAALAAAPYRAAFAAADTDRRLVIVLLRGGMDGLAAVPPLADRDFERLRGAPDDVVALDADFGLHPELAELAPLFRARELAFAHAVATPYRERSHFDAQDLLENGTNAPRGATDGWLNRAIALMGSDGRRLGLAVGDGMPLVLRGSAQVASFEPTDRPTHAGFLALVARLHENDPVLGPALTEGIRARGFAQEVLGDSVGAVRGRGEQQAQALAKAAAGLLAAADGPRVAVLEVPGWDTHAGQSFRIREPLRALAATVLALKTGLGSAWRDTAVVVASEFGRTVRLNGTGGTDHGTGQAVLLAGGAIVGGRSVGRWPGLAEDRLFQGRDLAPTTDLRAILKGVLVEHMGLARAEIDRAVFPASGDAAPVRGLVRG